MALAATGMADLAVRVSGLANLFKNLGVFFVGAGLDRSIERRQCIMQAVSGRGNDLFVAFPAGLIRIRKGGVFYNAFVRRLPVGVLGIAPVAVFTGNLAMIGLQKGRFDINLFIKLQRSQRSASSFTGSFRRLGWPWFDLFHLPAQADQFFQVGVAGNTLTLRFQFLVD